MSTPSPKKIVIAGAFQILCLIAMIAWAALPVLTGTEVLLQTRPVDPRDLFRGNYVALSYEINRLPLELLENAETDLSHITQGTPVFVRLLPSGKDQPWKVDRISLKPFSSGVFLRGKARYYPSDMIDIEYGLEAFYCPLEKAKSLERDFASGNLLGQIFIANGRSRLNDLVKWKSRESASP
ncbi:MAG: GDYXXLXY domain-containing protein [Candidatus Cloacimonetes bacterium]|nr:GDYXXLXY domain-containing protein [Candidatus Cloacimonadota bacterium]